MALSEHVGNPPQISITLEPHFPSEKITFSLRGVRCFL
jgi:hypothetical protein